jgi:DNA/RNA endonuclease G (NUC1)
MKTPIYVIYDIKNAGGSCDRGSSTFKTAGMRRTAKASDYKKSGYDQGHLVPYEDFAFNCRAAEATFRYHNAIPQTPNLNRGEWKKWEYIIRRISKIDSIRVIAGGAEYKTFIGDSVYVPNYCWKLVYSKTRKVVIYALLFKNDNFSGRPTEETITTLERKIGYNIRQHLR